MAGEVSLSGVVLEKKGSFKRFCEKHQNAIVWFFIFFISISLVFYGVSFLHFCSTNVLWFAYAAAVLIDAVFVWALETACPIERPER